MQIKSIDALSLKKRLDKGDAVLIDVREAHEHAREHIEGARLAPLSRFQTEDFSELREKTAVFYCHSGGRTGSNARLLASKGFRERLSPERRHLGLESGRAADPLQARRVGRGRAQTLRVAVLTARAEAPPWFFPGHRMRWQCSAAARWGSRSD
jgi:rhodanese-related sulfurtransferase